MHEVETRERDAGTAALPLPQVFSPKLPQVSAIKKVGLRDADWSRRRFVLLPFAMIGGLIAYAALPMEPETWALVAVAASLAIAMALLWCADKLQACCELAALLLGFCLLPLHGAFYGTEMLAYPAFGFYEAKVLEVLSSDAEGQRLVINGLLPVTDARPLPITNARLLAPPDVVVAPGDVIRASMRLAPVPGPILPGAYDGQFHSYFAGIGAYGSVTGEFALVRQGEPGLAGAVEGVRSGIGARIDAVLDDRSAAIGRAMVMGDQSGIDDETREVMAASGLAHIYSISGLHLSIVAGGLYFLLRLGMASLPGVAVRWPVKKIAAVGGIVAAGLYLLLAGGLNNVPALRSTIMLGLIFGAVLAGRRALTMRNVAIAALAIIVIDPASVFRASFQLSFAAVVALIGIYEMPRQPFEGERGWGRRLWRTVWTTAATSFIAGTATLLFSAYHFQQTAPLGVLGNVLVLPVVSLVIMPFAVLSVLAMPFGVEAPFVAVMGWGIDRMVDGAVLVAGWSTGWMGNPLLTDWVLVIGFVALAWFAFVSNWWRLAGPVVALPLILLVGLDQRPDILIADTTQAVAVRDSDGYGLVSGKADSFAVDAWSRHYQAAFVEGFAGAGCDSLGCIATTDRFSIAVIRNAAAFAEDCGWHDLVIARIRAPSSCQGGQVVDADDLAAGGVHWLAWDETAARFEIRTAIPNLARPWRVWRP